jgi:uncharacterized protein (DUF1697 family)
MQKFTALLRGINVSGKNMIRMEPLRDSLTRSGFREVKTYLQSGNVVFSHEQNAAARLAAVITGVIYRDFGLKVPVIVLSMETLGEILEESPFYGSGEYDRAGCYITFLSEPPQHYDPTILERKRADESFLVTQRAVHLYCPGGYGDTKLNNNFIESQFKVAATTRNHRTVEEILKM